MGIEREQKVIKLFKKKKEKKILVNEDLKSVILPLADVSS